MKYKNEIEFEKVNLLLDKLTDYSLTNDKYQILIYGQGSKPRSFYQNLKTDKDIELIWTGWCGPTWTLIFSFIPGQSGLIKLKNKKRLKEIYNVVGSQSFCALCFVDKETEDEIIHRVTQKDKRKISELIENSDGNFMLDIDFDFHGGQRDGEAVYKIAYVGQNVDSDIVNLLSVE